MQMHSDQTSMCCPQAALHCSPELTSGSQCMTGLQDKKQSAAQGCSNTTEQTEKRIRSCRRMKQQIQSYWDQTGDSAAQCSVSLPAASSLLVMQASAATCNTETTVYGCKYMCLRSVYQGSGVCITLHGRQGQISIQPAEHIQAGLLCACLQRA